MSDRGGPTWFELTGIGVMSALCILAGVGGGYAVGSSTGTGPALTFVGLAIGIVAAVATTYKKIKRYL